MSVDKPETIVAVDDLTVDDSSIAEDTIVVEDSTVAEDSSIVEDSTVATDSSSKTIIELLRHGELEGGNTFRGSTDDQLTDSGWQQMVSAIEGRQEWDIIITSPLSNCREFAEVIAQEDEVDLEINNQFKEIDFGDWEDKTPKQLLKDDADLLAAWWQSPTHITPPNGEDFLDFKARVLKAFKEVLQEYQGKRILIVTHSGVVRVIIMNILGMQDANLFSLNVNDASFSKIVIENDNSDVHGVLVEHH